MANYNLPLRRRAFSNLKLKKKLEKNKTIG